MITDPHLESANKKYTRPQPKSRDSSYNWLRKTGQVSTTLPDVDGATSISNFIRSGRLDTVNYGIDTAVVFDGALSTPEESTLLTT